MAEPSPAWPRWREEADYAALHRTGALAIAWEWLRRDPAYRATACEDFQRRSGVPGGFAAQPAAARWGLHAFEDPDLLASVARPVWRREWLPTVLVASARPLGPPDDGFDLRRFAGLATMVRGSDAREHLLLSDGASSLRIDVSGAPLMAGPVWLAYELAGLTGVRPPLATLMALLALCRTGRLPKPRVDRRTARHILVLRARDALAAGASQREVAEVLLSREATRVRWRSEVPGLRLRAQRLVKGAREMAAGRYRELLG